MDQQKWVTKLLGSDYDIVYKRGTKNLVVDALSHLPEQAEPHTISTTTSPILEPIKEEQNNDPELQKIVRKLARDLASVSHHSWAMNHLCYKGPIILGTNSTHKSTILQELHATLSTGHSRFLQTYKRISRLSYWKEECEVCQQQKDESLLWWIA